MIVVQTEVGLRRVLSEAGFEIETIRSSSLWMAVSLLIRRRLVPAGAGVADEDVANPRHDQPSTRPAEPLRARRRTPRPLALMGLAPVAASNTE
jgi:hypothetical protein